MAAYVLENDTLKLTVTDHGAEIRSIVDKASGYEYMWQADPAYWGRTSPVLFPLVGNYRDKTSVYDGREYHLTQHGFARDMDFTVASQTNNEIVFMLTDTLDTLTKYPFHFILTIGYRLTDRNVTVIWRVSNANNPAQMYFSIGGHPAFNCPVEDCILSFDTDGPLVSDKIMGGGSGCIEDGTYEIPLTARMLKLDYSMFDHDALVIENSQASQVKLSRPDGRELVELSFDAPLFGIWTPAGKRAPFLCIEPWFGRTDRATFNHKLEEREYGIALSAGYSWQHYYTIHAFEQN